MNAYNRYVCIFVVYECDMHAHAYIGDPLQVLGMMWESHWLFYIPSS